MLEVAVVVGEGLLSRPNVRLGGSSDCKWGLFSNSRKKTGARRGLVYQGAGGQAKAGRTGQARRGRPVTHFPTVESLKRRDRENQKLVQ